MSRVFLNAINLFSSNSSEKSTRSTDVFTNSIFMSDFYCVNNEYLPSFVQEYEDTSPRNLYNDAPSVPPPPTVSEKEFARSTCMPKIETFQRDNGVKEITLDNGLKINATIYTKLKGVQSEWLDQLKYMQQAADELGLVLVFGELSRTVEISNTGNQNKGSVVAKGGSSPHNYGVAADILLFDKASGKTINKISTIQEKFANRVKELSSGKIAWGGDWNKPNEEHHFELADWKDSYKKTENLIV